MSTTQPKVWVMALSGGVPVWNSGLWFVTNRLIPDGSDYNPTATGRATFRMLRATRQDTSAGGVVVDSFLPTKGQYVAITDATSTNPGVNGVLFWFGVFDEWVFQIQKNSTDCIGHVSGIGAGAVLDQIPVANLHRVSSASTGIPMQSFPTFNMEGWSSGVLVGNMATGGDGHKQFISNVNVGAGQLWDRYSMLDHVCTYVPTTSAKIPPLSLAMVTAVQTLLSTAFPEVIPTEGLTVKGFLDLLVGPARGLLWTIGINSTGWVIDVYSGVDAAVGSIPAAALVNATLDGTDDSVVFHSGAMDDYDAVQIEGGPIVYCGTVSPIDFTLYSGWNGTQMTDFGAGASAITGFTTSYTLDQMRALDRQVRSSPLLCDVFTRYVLVQDTNGDFNCKGVSGVPTGGSTQPLCPTIDWDGTTATVDASAKSTPYPPEARLLHQLPWPAGVHADGTDDRAAEQQVRPMLISPVVLTYRHPAIYNSSDPTPIQYVDLLRPPLGAWAAVPSVTIDDRGPAIRIRYSYPEMLAIGSYTPNLWDEYDPANSFNDGVVNPASNWTQLIVTIAIQGDQRVRVINYKAGYSASTVRNVLRVQRPDLTCWLVRKYTFLGMKVTGVNSAQPDELAADTFVRNDFPVAQKLADELAAYAFRVRTGATITLQGLQIPAWGQIGVMIGNLVEQNGTTTSLHTLVANLHFDYNPKHPRTIITCGDPVLPSSQALQPQVPAFGGPVSTSMGSSLASLAQKLQAATKQVAKAAASLPVGRYSESPIPMATYAVVRWDLANGGVDNSECMLVNYAGSAIAAGAVGWIDAISSKVYPQFFGAARFRVTRTGTATRGGVTRPLYRVESYVAGGTAADTASVVSAGVGEMWASGSAITTTIWGVTKSNKILVTGMASTVAFQHDLTVPLPYSLPIGNLPTTTVAFLATNRQTKSGGTFETGELIRIDLSGSFSGTAAGTGKAKTINFILTMTCKLNTSGSLTLVAMTASYDSLSLAPGATYAAPVYGHGAFSVFSSLIVSGTGYQATDGSDAALITPSFTVDAYGRCSGITWALAAYGGFGAGGTVQGTVWGGK